MNIYLSLDIVKQALHVPTDAVFFQCDNGADFTYDTTQPDLVSWYRDIIASNTLRVLVYNGDTDPCISAYQAETWTASLGFPVLQSWRPWTIDGKEVEVHSGRLPLMGIDWESFQKMESGIVQWTTRRTSGLCTPIPKAEVATITWSSPLTQRR